MPYPVAAVRNKILVPSAAVQTYSEKVLAMESANLLAYFICGEASGTVMQEEKNNYDGLYAGVTLGETGIGDGNTCPWWDGANDEGDIYTAGLNSGFSGTEGTAMVWAKVNSSAVWTDGTVRSAMAIAADVNNLWRIERSSTNNTLNFRYTGAGTSKSIVVGSLSYTTWMCLLAKWSDTNDYHRAYINGSLVGTPASSIPTWVGALDATRCNVGARTNGPVDVWHGWLAHAAEWNTLLSDAQILDLATV